MTEQKILVDNLTLKYEGRFELEKAYKCIEDWFTEHGYGKQEYDNSQVVTKNGKQVKWVMRAWKDLGNSRELLIRVKFNVADMIEETIEKDGIRKKVNKGIITIIFDGWLMGELEAKWEQKPVYYFLREVFEKFLYRARPTDAYEAQIKKEADELLIAIRSHLNLYRY